MRFITTFLCCVVPVLALAQGDSGQQYQLIKGNITKPFERLFFHTGGREQKFLPDTFFIDHIVRKYSDGNKLNRFISNRFFLEKFTDVTLKMNQARLSSKDNSVEINIRSESKPASALGNIVYDSIDFNGYERIYDHRFITSIDGVKLFGHVKDSSMITFITELSIKVGDKQIEVGREMFADLSFPNLCEVNYAVRPVEAYWSPDKRYVYIYLFGGQPNNLYFCKIIFDMAKLQTVGRMIADFEELQLYQCIYPKSFIGF